MAVIDIREWAQRYIDKGFQVVPLAPGKKACKDDAWQKLVFTPEEFEPGDNIGLRSVDGRVIVDVDAPEAVLLADKFLPHTACIWQRKSMPRAKRMYLAEVAKWASHKSVTGHELVALHVNHQDMAPPSIHPEGEQLEWVEFGEPATVDGQQLARDIQLLATATLTAQNYPAAGARHDWCLHLAGSFVGFGLDVDEALKVIEAAAQLAEDTKLNDRLREVRSTYENEEKVATLKEPKEFVAALKRIWPNAGAKSREGFETHGRGVIPNRVNIVKALEKFGVTTRFDTFSSTYYVMSPLPRVFDDDCLDDLRIRMDEKCGFLPSPELTEAVIKYLGRQNSFNPVCEYLDSLTWDGTPRIDSWLHTYAKAKGDENGKLIRAQAAITLMAAVKRARNPGCKFDEMLVLIGEQGTDKSQAVAALCPNPEWFSDGLPLGADAKIVIERTVGKWIIEAGELAGFNNKDLENLKQFMARGVDGPTRLAYGRMSTRVPRQFILIGTTNKRQFLQDVTGNRRFWPVVVEKFDLAALRRDRDQLWAEASHRVANGESIRLPEELWEAAAEEQRAAALDDEWSDVIDEWLQSEDCKNPDLISVRMVWEQVGKAVKDLTARDTARIAGIMQAKGFEKTSRHLNEDGEIVYKGGKSVKVWKRKNPTKLIPNDAVSIPKTKVAKRDWTSDVPHPATEEM